MKRRRISTKERAALFAREGGICHLCRGLVRVGEAYDISHEIALELGGADEGANLRVAHRKCHKVHTATKDVPAIAKAKRREAIHIGAKKPAGRIKSAGFAKPERKTREQMAIPPRRDIYGRPL